MMPNHEFILALSGGKDSTATWCLLLSLGLRPVVIFSDTGWEHPLTYQYLDYLEAKLGKIERLRGQFTMFSLAQHKGRFPGKMSRFCTEYLKVLPTRDWIAAEGIRRGWQDPCLVLGIRAQESRRRALLTEYESDSDAYRIAVWRPILRWSVAQVFERLRSSGIDPNPLYKHGFDRVGCAPCIFARKRDLATWAIRFPEIIDKVRAAEKTLHSTFFGPRRPGIINDIDDQVAWALGGEPDLPFEEPGCVSVFGLCE